MTRARVVIVQRYVTHYRVPFFQRLRADLAAHDVQLDLVHGIDVDEDEAEDKDDPSFTQALPWSILVANRWVGIRSKSLLWQSAMRHVHGADLVIVEQASARLLNYRLFASQITGRRRLAFWGHGRNFKPHKASRPGESVKRTMSTRVHWWFAYNHLSAEVVRDLGFPPERITNVQNAVDTRELRRAHLAVSEEDAAAVRTELGAPRSPIGIYVGTMYDDKRLAFLVAAAEHLRALVPDFVLVLVGEGPDEHIAAQAARRHSWVRYLGPKRGIEMVPYVSVADLFLMPGLVGLAILDAFALEAPIVTTQDAPHSPEIAYLEDGRNGVMLPEGTTAQEYAQQVARLLGDHQRLQSLRAGGRAAAERYTIEEMSARFTGGVVEALSAPPLRGVRPSLR